MRLSFIVLLSFCLLHGSFAAADADAALSQDKRAAHLGQRKNIKAWRALALCGLLFSSPVLIKGVGGALEYVDRRSPTAAGVLAAPLAGLFIGLIVGLLDEKEGKIRANALYYGAKGGQMSVSLLFASLLAPYGNISSDYLNGLFDHSFFNSKVGSEMRSIAIYITLERLFQDSLIRSLELDQVESDVSD